jgi:hypothetical protein
VVGSKVSTTLGGGGAQAGQDLLRVLFFSGGGVRSEGSGKT